MSTNHRDWMNPQGIGFDSTTDFHPVVCVGAMEDSVSNGLEYKASYSNNGPGIDVSNIEQTDTSQSIGLKNVIDRIKLISNFEKKKNTLEIINRTNIPGTELTGTEVRITIVQ